VRGVLEFHIEIVDANSGELLRAIGPVDGTGSAAPVADELSRDVAGALDTLVARAPGPPDLGSRDVQSAGAAERQVVPAGR
jgi:hypothetical protein